MKVFLDTNVIFEYFTIREEYEVVKALFQLLHKMDMALYMSVGSFYTMVFLIDKVLRKESGLKGEIRLQALRDIMERILRTVSVAEHDNDTLLEALNDRRFKDIEDSCQYELAQKTGCQVLITFNIEDFPISEDSPVTIVTPQEFLLKILYSCKEAGEKGRLI